MVALVPRGVPAGNTRVQNPAISWGSVKRKIFLAPLPLICAPPSSTDEKDEKDEKDETLIRDEMLIGRTSSNTLDRGMGRGLSWPGGPATAEGCDHDESSKPAASQSGVA